MFEAAGHEVVLIDNPVNRDNLSVHDYINHVNTKVSAVGPCIVIGHSMGGLVTQAVASINDNVQKAVMITSGAPKGICSLTPEISIRMMRLYYQRAMITGQEYRIREADARALMMNRLNSSHNPSDIFGTESGKVTREMAYSRIPVAKINCPSLVVGGKADKMTPLRVQRKIAGKHNSILWVEDCGHLPMMEDCSQSLARKVIEWVS